VGISTLLQSDRRLCSVMSCSCVLVASLNSSQFLLYTMSLCVHQIDRFVIEAVVMWQTACDTWAVFWVCQDGGSLDLILKKAGRIPEPILGKISGDVSVYLLNMSHYWSTTITLVVVLLWC